MSLADNQKKYREKIRAEGRCVSCKGDKEDPNKACCYSCSKKATRDPDAWKRRSEKLQKSGLCVRCGTTKPLNGKKNCEVCLNAESVRSRELKRKVVTAYGSICICCKETDLGFLTIDHINSDGASHRRKLYGKNTCGKRFYKWIVDNDYPKNLQVLCFNCNCGRQLNKGVCPHKCGVTQVD